jgi:hypothetical protein
LSRSIFNAAIRSRCIRRSYHELAFPAGVELYPVGTRPAIGKRGLGTLRSLPNKRLVAWPTCGTIKTGMAIDGPHGDVGASAAGSRKLDAAGR